MHPITDPALIAGYLKDASNVQGHADALLRPSTDAEVAAIVRHCQTQGIPLTVTAARTSTTAAPVPFGGWVMSLERLNRVHAIGEGGACADAGVLLGELQAQIEATGAFFPPDPTSRHDCTLGGAIACNASGARSFRYGPTRPWIDAVDVVLPTGEQRHVTRQDPLPPGWPAVAWTEPAVKTAAGYSPTPNLLDLLIGSEGTLGVITRAWVRTIPLPADVFALMVWFPNRTAAVDFVQRARARARAQDPLVAPRCLEYFDHHCLALAAARLGEVPPDARAAVFCEQEVGPEGEDAHLTAWWELLEDTDALADDTLVANDPPSQQRLLALRHAVPAGVNETVARNGMPKVGTDLAVPDDALIELMDAYEASTLDHVLFGHIGDNHLHLNLLPKTTEELEQARAWYAHLARLAIARGGTVSAEHGIGKLKRGYLRSMLGDDVLERFAALKRAADPSWILGRGTLLDAPEG